MNRPLRKNKQTLKQNSRGIAAAQKLKLPLMTNSISAVADRAKPPPMQRRAIRQRAAMGSILADSTSLRSSSAPEAFYHSALIYSKKDDGASAWADNSGADTSSSSMADNYGQDFDKARRPNYMTAKIVPRIGTDNLVEAEHVGPKSMSAELASLRENLPSLCPNNDQCEQPLYSPAVMSKILTPSAEIPTSVKESTPAIACNMVRDCRSNSDAHEEPKECQAPNVFVGAETRKAESLEKENVSSSITSECIDIEGVALSSGEEASGGTSTNLSPAVKRNTRLALIGAVQKVVEEIRSDAPVMSAQEQIIDEISDDEEGKTKGAGDAGRGKSTTKITGLASAVAKDRKAHVDALDQTQLCRDISGRRHVVKELRQQRYKAVTRGMHWLEKFLKSDGHVARHWRRRAVGVL